MPSRSIQVVTKGRFPSFYGWIIFLCVCVCVCVCVFHVFSIHSSINGHLGCFCVLAIVNNASMNTGMQISLQDSDFFSFRSGIQPKVKLLDHMVVLFSVFWGSSMLFSITAEPLHSHQQCTSIPFSLYLHQHLSLVFFIIAILTGVRQYLTAVFICTSLVINDVEHVFLYLLAIWISSFEKCLLSPLSIFNRIGFLLLSCMNSLIILDINPLSYVVFKYFLPLYKLLFHFVDNFLCYIEVDEF